MIVVRAEGLVHRCVVLPLYMIDRPSRHIQPGDGFQLHTQDDRVKLRYIQDGFARKLIPKFIIVSLCSTWMRHYETPKEREPVSCLGCAAFGAEVFGQEHFEIQWIAGRK